MATTAHTSPPSSPLSGRQPPEPNGIPTEQAMGRAILKGWAVGVPGLFALIVGISFLAGADPLLAAEIAAFPALVCGGFLSAAIFIGLASAHSDH